VLAGENAAVSSLGVQRLNSSDALNRIDNGINGTGFT